MTIRMRDLMNDGYPNANNFQVTKDDFYDTQEVTGTVKVRQDTVTEVEARRIYTQMNYTQYDFNEFLMGMNVELEHRDVTGGDLALTAKIAAKHLNEVPNYYTLLKQYVEK